MNLKYSHNQNVFQQLNNNSEYWLGFFTADGSISLNKTRSPAIRLELKNEDKGHLSKWVEFLESTHPIHDYAHKKNDGISYSSSVQIRSKGIYNSLCEYGLAGHSIDREPVEELLNSRHFWRGVVDGDGSISWNRYDNYPPIPALHLCGSRFVVSSFFSYIRNLSPNITNTISRRSSDHEKFCYKRITGKNALIAIKHLYTDSTPYLDRKHLTAKEILHSYGLDI